jgi:uncharacterized protein (AIM24 family)
MTSYPYSLLGSTVPVTAAASPPPSNRLSTMTEDGKNDPTGAMIVPGIPIMEGFEQWLPPKPSVYKDGLPVYEILGTDAQIVQFPVRPGRAIMCFSGAMAYMSDGMKMEAKLSSFGTTFGRVAGGGSLFQLTYTNESEKDGFIACTPDYPGVIVPIHMADCPSGKIVALRDSFLCATYGLGDATCDVGAGFNPASSATGFCCSGFDFIVQTVSNGEWAFLMAMGTVLQKVSLVCRTRFFAHGCFIQRCFVWFHY